MKIDINTKEIITEVKCDITLHLQSEREILALENICLFARREFVKRIHNPEECKEEFELIEVLRSIITKKP